MYKIFSGEKYIVISEKGMKSRTVSAKVIQFESAEQLHQEYKLFASSAKWKELLIIGNEELIWNVFCSLFSYIEAAGGIVRNEKGNVLMIYRNDHWDLPKGKMEKGETAGQAALREVEEECGVKQLNIVKQLPSTYHIFFQKNESMKCTYWFEMTSKDPSKPVPQAEEGIKEAKWMSREEVQKVMKKIYPSLHEVLSFLLSPSP